MESPQTPVAAASVAGRCWSQFSAIDRENGAAYQRSGRARVLARRETGVDAEVQGSRPYDVSLQWDGSPGELWAFCDCPRFAGEGVCKHIWAVALEIDREGEPVVPGSGALTLQAMGREEDFPTPDTGPALATPVTPRAAPPPPPSAWRRTVAQLASLLERERPRERAAKAARAALEPWYAIDLASIRARGTLELSFFQRRQRRDGTASAFKSLGADRALVQHLPTAQDRQLLALLRELPARATWYGSPGSAYGFGEEERVRGCTVPANLYEYLLPRLAATGRLTLCAGPGSLPDASRVLRWEEGAWRFRLAAERQSEDGSLVLRGELWRGDETRAMDAPLVLTAAGLAIFPATIAAFDAGDAFAWVATLRSGSLTIPAHEAGEAMATLSTLPSLPPLVGADDVLPRRERHPPVPRLTLLRGATDQRRHQASVAFVYDKLEATPDDPRNLLHDEASGRLLQRDPEAEAAALQLLASLGAKLTAVGSEMVIEIGERHLSPLVEKLLDAGWTVDAEGAPIRRASSLRFSVSSGIDWLDLAVAADFDGVAPGLEDLLSALSRRQRFVRLGDGSHGMLPAEWLERYGSIGRLASAHTDEGLQFLPSQALLLDALLAEAPQVDIDGAFVRLRERLRRTAGVAPAEPSAGFQGTLRDYQKQGLAWLRFLRDVGLGGCLADDMGLGKTIQVLAHLVSLRHAALGGATPQGEPSLQEEPRPGRPAEGYLPSLVIAPRSVVHNWIDEASRFAPSLRVLDYSGLERGTLRPRFGDHDLVIATYGVVRRDALILREQRFNYLVLDEAQAIKNSATQAYKACRLLQANHRLALSGTPVENHLGELWSLLELLNPGLLGRLPAQQNAVQAPMLSDGELAAVGRAIRPFLLRRTKEEVLGELPPKTEQTLFCTLEPPQQRLYDQLKRHYQESLRRRIAEVGMGRAKIHVLEALLRLRQAACHSGLVDPSRAEEGGGKLETLLSQLVELRQEGHKALVFSQFTRLLALVKPRLEAAGIPYEYLDGRTRDRRARVARFEHEADCGVFLVSLKAGGLGLNLTAASYVFLLDPWWNPAAEAQAIDRAHRIGQHRAVFAYRLIAAGTVEERIVELQRSKRRVADAILGADASALGQLTVEDLELLLR